jgi:HEAT repeat protein
LQDLLTDLDANVRAVAAISLARTEAQDAVTVKFLTKTLNDKDRLVREAGCLALGHLQARQAVPKLLHLWYDG